MKEKNYTVQDKRGVEIPAPKDYQRVVPQEVVQVPDPIDPATINIEMCDDRILIQEFPKAEKIGNIFTPDHVEIPIDRGRICKVGPDVKYRKVGDVIFKVSSLGQRLVDSRGREYIFLPEKGAIAVDTDPYRNDTQHYDREAHT